MRKSKNMNHWFKGRFPIRTMKLSESLYFLWKINLNKSELRKNLVTLTWFLKTLLKDQTDIFIWLIGNILPWTTQCGTLQLSFLESEFTTDEEDSFLSYYESEQTPVSREKIRIYKILQDIIWSLWTIYKEENGADFGDYGISRYNRAVKELDCEGDLDEN